MLKELRSCVLAQSIFVDIDDGEDEDNRIMIMSKELFLFYIFWNTK